MVLLQRTPGKHGQVAHSSMSSLQVRPEKHRGSPQLNIIIFCLMSRLSLTCCPCRTDAGEGVDSVQAASQPAGVRLAVVYVDLALDPRKPGWTQAPVRLSTARHICRTGSSVQTLAGADRHLAARGAVRGRITGCCLTIIFVKKCFFK